MKHILLKTAFTYKKRKKIEEPEGYIFDSKIGAWIDKARKTFLIDSPLFQALATKKNDIETGEDQKGE